MTVKASVDLELVRAVMLFESDPAAAARGARQILAAHPGHPEASLLLASACRRLGDPATAVSALESLASACRDTAVIQLELGRAYAAHGRGPDALAAYRRAVTLEADLADGWRELASQLFALGETQAGDAAYANFSRLTPDPPELVDATVALRENRMQAAETLLRRRLEQAPHDVIALRMLADIATRRNDFAAAERRLNDCLELAPGHAAARFDLANALFAQHRHSEVLPHLDRLLACEPREIKYLSLKAQTLRLLNRNEETVVLMEQAVAAHPDNDRIWLLFGHVLREIGPQARAIEMYRRALTVQPGSGRAYWSLADVKTFRFDAADVARMQEQLAGGHVKGIERTHLEFALGKALEDEGQYAASFEHYARGNALHRPMVADAGWSADDARRLKLLHTEAFFAERSAWGSTSVDPIFIVGLPRSGSTLLEQMLACHSQIEGTRELTDVRAIALELNAAASEAGQPEYPEVIATLSRGQIEALSARYLSRTQQHRSSGKPRFVDKMLDNFGYLALIHLMFPRAAIIDARRHPLGCSFSCYKQLFGRGHGYTYDLAELGHFYRGYAELMEHFDAVLPKRVHRVHYEHLVADPEGELRRILDYCGLPFEAECLRFYENRRVVQTISSEQVRRPIYADSVHQWRHYEPWLGPLKDALGNLVDNYPEPRPAGH